MDNNHFFQNKSPAVNGKKVSEELEQKLILPWSGLRQDITLHKGLQQSNGKLTYIVEDPVQGLHFELAIDHRQQGCSHGTDCGSLGGRRNSGEDGA